MKYLDFESEEVNSISYIKRLVCKHVLNGFLERLNKHVNSFISIVRKKQMLKYDKKAC